jgi:hypothetical protein
MRNILEKAPTMGDVTLLANPHKAKHRVMSTKAVSEPPISRLVKELFLGSFIVQFS